MTLDLIDTHPSTDFSLIPPAFCHLPLTLTAWLGHCYHYQHTIDLINIYYDHSNHKQNLVNDKPFVNSSSDILADDLVTVRCFGRTNEILLIHSHIIHVVGALRSLLFT